MNGSDTVARHSKGKDIAKEELNLKAETSKELLLEIRSRLKKLVGRR